MSILGFGSSGATAYKGSLYLGIECARTLSPTVPNNGSAISYGDVIYKVDLNAAGNTIVSTSLFKDYFLDNGIVNFVAGSLGTTNPTIFPYDLNWGDFVIINDTLFDRGASLLANGDYEIYTRAFRLSSISLPVVNDIIPVSIVNSYLQTAEDGNHNLILMGQPDGTAQKYLIANKATCTYNEATSKSLKLNGVNFTRGINDATGSFIGKGSIGNTVWNDINANGIKEATERGIPEVPVELWEDLNNNLIIDVAIDKLTGTAITDFNGHYEFKTMMPGSYLVRTIATTSVNYPAQSFSASYPSNPLTTAGTLIDAGDENIGGAISTNLIGKSFSGISYNDQAVDFGFTGSFSILPINNLSFKANYINQDVKINWKLFIEGSEKEYSIERSIDGNTFTSIEVGDISGNNLISKTSVDKNLPINTPYLYYRLKVLYQTGKYNTSDVVKVKINNSDKKSIVTYPNPTKGIINLILPIQLLNKNIEVIVTNSAGNKVKSFTFSNVTNPLSLSLKGLPKAVYYLKIQSNSQIFSSKVRVE
jgi:hypothetical protein